MLAFTSGMCRMFGSQRNGHRYPLGVGMISATYILTSEDYKVKEPRLSWCTTKCQSALFVMDSFYHHHQNEPFGDSTFAIWETGKLNRDGKSQKTLRFIQANISVSGFVFLLHFYGRRQLPKKKIFIQYAHSVQ